MNVLVVNLWLKLYFLIGQHGKRCVGIFLIASKKTEISEIPARWQLTTSGNWLWLWSRDTVDGVCESGGQDY